MVLWIAPLTSDLAAVVAEFVEFAVSLIDSFVVSALVQSCCHLFVVVSYR